MADNTNVSDDFIKEFFNTPNYKLLFGNQNQLDPNERFNFEQSPGYQFQMDEGMRNLQRNYAARGLLESGPVMKELLKYSQGLASQDYNRAYDTWVGRQQSLFNNYQNQLLGLSNMGAQFSGAPEAFNLGSTNSQYAYNTGPLLANLGQQYGQNTGSIYANEGPFYSNLFMNTAAAKAQNFGNNYAMNMQMQNNNQASSAGNSAGNNLFGSMRF